jgi:hypothetical protein
VSYVFSCGDSYRGLSDYERARRWLVKVEGTVSKKHGHDKTFRVARRLIEKFGLSKDEAFALMKREYNPRCRPPWSEGELRHKVYNEPVGAHSRAGTGAPEVQFDPDYLAWAAAPLASISDELPEWLEARSRFTCWNRSPAGVIHKLHSEGESAVILTRLDSKIDYVFIHLGPEQDLSGLDDLRRGQPFGVWWIPNPCDGRLISSSGSGRSLIPKA